MTSADHILDQIDGALADYDIGPDAMRCTPDLPPPTPAIRPRAHGSTVLARRLADRHGLTPEQARAAVLDLEQGHDTEHARLAAAEARAALEEIHTHFRSAFQGFTERVTQQMLQVAEGFARLKEALGHAPEAAGCNDCGAPPRPRDRPAWQSPYGPPRRRR